MVAARHIYTTANCYARRKTPKGILEDCKTHRGNKVGQYTLEAKLARKKRKRSWIPGGHHDGPRSIFHGSEEDISGGKSK